MATPKQRLRKSIEALTEEQIIQVLQWLQRLRDTGQGTASAPVVVPPTDAPPFAEFDPIVLPGPPASELLIADRR